MTEPLYLWVDSKGKIRESNTPPTSDSKGKILGETEVYRIFRNYLASLKHCYVRRKK